MTRKHDFEKAMELYCGSAYASNTNYTNVLLRNLVK